MKGMIVYTGPETKQIYNKYKELLDYYNNATKEEQEQLLYLMEVLIVVREEPQ